MLSPFSLLTLWWLLRGLRVTGFASPHPSAPGTDQCVLALGGHDDGMGVRARAVCERQWIAGCRGGNVGLFPPFTFLSLVPAS
jgi:hypothetical protein